MVAAGWFAASLQQHGFNLDFSFESLAADIDQILLLPTFLYGKDAASTQEAGRYQAGLGAYIGETLRRLYGGEWQGFFDSRDPLPNGYLSFVRFAAYQFCPSAFIAYRLSNGEESEGPFREYLEKVVFRIEQAKETGV